MLKFILLKFRYQVTTPYSLLLDVQNLGGWDEVDESFSKREKNVRLMSCYSIYIKLMVVCS
jgi:hypothetical protein